MILNLQEVARAMQAAGQVHPIPVTGWSVDTRTQNAGDLYFALRGPNHDGHDYVASALAKGAAGVVLESGWEAAPELRGRQLVVADTLQALQDLGAWARRRWDGRVVGVTGSAGKTTTKDAIADLLQVELTVGRTIGNFNNHVGVPLSILRLPDECRAAVLEMGMNHAGEIRALAAIARPDVGVVTNVGYAHVEFFGSIDGVATAKRELIEALPPDGTAVLNADDARVRAFRATHPGRTVTFGFAEDADVRAEAFESSPATAGGGAGPTRFRALGVDFETTLSGRHGVMNLLAAIAVARVFDIAPERLREPVRRFSTGKMRGERTEHRGIAIWNDCYNSNPEASQSMIDVLRETPARRRFAVLGEMLELGRASEELHRRVGRYAADHGVDFLIGVHGQASVMVEEAVRAGLPANRTRFFEDACEAGDYLRTLARSGDAVLFKASRGVRVERALERFMA